MIVYMHGSSITRGGISVHNRCNLVLIAKVAVMIARKEETKWIDAWIRWERNTDCDHDDENNNDNDDEQQQPPTTNVFTFSYRVPSNENNKSDAVVDIYLDGYALDSEQTWNSTGLTLWRSSEYLCEYLVQNHEKLVADRNILELGSGLGRCGILAHKLQEIAAAAQTDAGRVEQLAARVVLTDGDTDVLTQLRANVKRNTTNDSFNRHDVDSVDVMSNAVINVQQLLWGQDNAQGFCDQHGTFDFIFGSDLVYVPSVIEPLFETVRVLLSDANDNHIAEHHYSPRFVMAHCQRRAGNAVSLEMVLQGASQQGLALVGDPQKVASTFEYGNDKKNYDQDDNDIVLLVFCKKDTRE